MEAKHVTLTISSVTDAMRNVMSGADANTFITSLLKAGWELRFVQFLGMSPDGISIFYLLTRPTPPTAK